jgi:hypothetical protein
MQLPNEKVTKWDLSFCSSFCRCAGLAYRQQMWSTIHHKLCMITSGLLKPVLLTAWRQLDGLGPNPLVQLVNIPKGLSREFTFLLECPNIEAGFSCLCRSGADK